MRRAALLILSPSLLVALAFILLFEAKLTKNTVPHTIAIVQLTEVDNATVAGFREAMAELGYREGADVTYLNSGVVGSTDRLEEAVRAHLQQNPDLFVVSSTPATQAVRRLTEAHRQPPVVFAPVNDPLSAGIVADLRHPGGYITGIRLPTGDDLRLQWLRRIAPDVERVYLPYSADDESSLTSLEQATTAAAALGLTLLPQPMPPEQDSGMSAAIAIPADADAVFLPRDSRIEADIAAIVAQAEQRRLPVSAPSQVQVEAGALYSYGFVHRDIGRQAARLVDQIFKGQAPGDLPVEMAENLLAVNLKAARRIGIVIPDDVLHQANYVVR